MDTKAKELRALPNNLYPSKKKDELRVIANPNIGTIDIETTSNERPSCYAIGFFTKKPVTFYIDKNLNSCLLVHSCIQEMMRYKYRNIVFYAHRFDAVFILKELLAFNETTEGLKNPYKIPEPLTRNSDILKLPDVHLTELGKLKLDISSHKVTS